PWEAAATDSAAFSVSAPKSVAIVSPTADELVEGARVSVVIAPSGFVTDGVAEPGHGAFQVKLDGTVVATKRTGTTVPLNGVAAGSHTLEVALTAADGTALTPPVTASVSFRSELLPPTLELVLPATTTLKEGLQRVAVVPHHFTFSGLAIPGPFVPATGGWQLLVDGVVKLDKLTQAQANVVLTAGAHTLTARLIDSTGALLAPAVEVSRTVDVQPLATAVSILAPTANSVVAKDFTVAVAFEDFTLSDQILEPGQPVVPGVGHFHAFLRKQGDTNFTYQGFYLTESFVLHVATAGVYDVKVALHYQNHTPVLPAVEAITTVTVSDVPGIRIQSPQADAVVGAGPLAVAVAVDNFEIIPIPGDGSVSDVKGHYHLFIDGAYQGFFLTPVAILDPLTTTPPLTPGKHTIEALLHRSDHSFITGSQGDTVSFTYDPTPKVMVVAPADDATVSTGPFELRIATRSFNLVDHAGQAPVAGEGHVHVFIDDAYENYHTVDRFPLTIAAPGPHTIRVELHENDHSAVAGTVPAFVNVNVDAVPRVRFVAPSEGTFTYGGDVDFMLSGWNVPDDADVQVEVDGEIAYVGPMDLEGLVDMPPLGEGMHTARATPLDESGDPMLGSVAEEVHFEVIGLDPPSLTFVSPAPNATVLPGSAITIGVTGFTLDDGLGRRPGVPGDGLWSLRVDDREWGPFAGPTATLPALPRGATTVVAELWHRDGSRVMPRRTASLNLTIGGTGPSVSIASPTPDASWYGPVRVAVDTGDFTFGPTSGWLSVKVDGEQAAFIAAAEGVLGDLRVGQHTLEVELIGGDRQPLVPPVKASGTFRVGGATVPSVRITAPADGADLSGGSVAVSFTLDGLALDPAATGGRRQPGKGAVLVLVDGHVEAIATASPLSVGGIGPGHHRIALAPAALDLTPIMPASGDAVEVDVAP
ncbi:MAG: hypothetical protein U1F43_18455, partial [Myxococcota bacterium]